MSVNDQWRTRAACRGMDLDTFVHSHDHTGVDACGLCDEALEVCGRCPVRQACLVDALLWEQDRYRRVGVRGGMRARQRRRLVRGRTA